MKSLLFVIALSTLFNNAKQQLSLQRDDRRLKLGNFRHLHGHRLNDQPRDTVELENEVQCISTCLRKQDCFSFNMKRTENSKFLCEFLNTSKYSNPTNLTRNDNYVHWYLQVNYAVKLIFIYNFRVLHNSSSSLKSWSLNRMVRLREAIHVVLQ